jgi:hypothetical protein
MNDPLLAPAHGAGWTHLWSSEHPDYDGAGVIQFLDANPWRIPGRSASLISCEKS